MTGSEGKRAKTALATSGGDSIAANGKIITGSLTGNLPDPSTGGGEDFWTIASLPGTRIERIVSRGHTTPAGEWYDQAWDEWVLLVEGKADLRLEGEDAPRRLNPGDFILLPRHLRHRVEWTAPNGPTVWLAIHCGEPAQDRAGP